MAVSIQADEVVQQHKPLGETVGNYITMCYQQAFELEQDFEYPQDDPESQVFGVHGRLTRAALQDRRKSIDRKEKSLCEFKRKDQRYSDGRTLITRHRNSLASLLAEELQVDDSTYEDSASFGRDSKCATSYNPLRQRSFFGKENSDVASATESLQSLESTVNLRSFKRIPKSQQLITNQTVKFEDLSQKLNILEGKFNRMKAALEVKRQDKVQFLRTQQEERKSIHQERTARDRANRERELRQQENRQKERNLQQEQRKEEVLKGVVTQVAERKDVRYLDHNPYSAPNHTYYVSEVLSTYKDSRSAAIQHIFQSMKMLKMMQPKVKSLSDNPPKSLSLPRNPFYRGKKTIIFDLDQTLVHCNQSPLQPCDLVIPIHLPNGDTNTAGINLRPYCRELLCSLSPFFQLIVFTASHSCYANVVLDQLDPDQKHISHRLYRQHCAVTPDGLYVKDLRVINRSLSEMVLVDNAAYSFCLQVENGVPIIPYYSGGRDYELRELESYLMGLRQVRDVREVNGGVFALGRYTEFDEPERLVERLYGKGM